MMTNVLWQHLVITLAELNGVHLYHQRHSVSYDLTYAMNVCVQHIGVTGVKSNTTCAFCLQYVLRYLRNCSVTRPSVRMYICHLRNSSSQQLTTRFSDLEPMASKEFVITICKLKSVFGVRNTAQPSLMSQMFLVICDFD